MAKKPADDQLDGEVHIDCGNQILLGVLGGYLHVREHMLLAEKESKTRNAKLKQLRSAQTELTKIGAKLKAVPFQKGGVTIQFHKHLGKKVKKIKVQ